MVPEETIKTMNLRKMENTPPPNTIDEPRSAIDGERKQTGIESSMPKSKSHLSGNRSDNRIEQSRKRSSPSDIELDCSKKRSTRNKQNQKYKDYVMFTTTKIKDDKSSEKFS